jgi:hypothetical protein
MTWLCYFNRSPSVQGVKAAMPGYNPSPEQESIYTLIPRYQAPTPKQALYRSKVSSFFPYSATFSCQPTGIRLQHLYICPQHKGKVDPKQYEMGVKKMQPAATFGHPYGMNSTSPDQFLKSHAQEPHLPERKLLIQWCSLSPESLNCQPCQ